jgi:sodium-coupled neutral amino acid transporter 11
LPAAVALIILLGALSAYTFGLYGRLIHLSQAKSLGELWEKEKGKKSAWLISVASMTFCFGAALSYSILLGDTFSALAHTGGLTGIGASRNLWILLITTTIIFPLCNLRSLLALAPLSMLGVFAILVTTVFLGWRCPSINMSSPYAVASGGALLDTLTSHQAPKFNTMFKGFGSPSSMILGGMAASSYMGHFSAPGFYHSVRKADQDDNVTSDSTTNRKALLDYFKVTLGGFGSITLINCLVMAFGFLTFGGNANGVILNNFSTIDPWASLCRLLMAVCVMGGYPFLIAGCRSEMLELWKRRTQREPTRRLEKTITATLLSILAGLGMVIKNAGFVIGLNGALMGSAMVYIFPSLLFLEHTKKLTGMSKRIRLERWFCRFLVGFGATAALMGGGISVIATYFPNSLL